MRISAIAFLAFFGFTTYAAAQQGGSLTGNWVGTMQQTSNSVNVELDLSETDGTFRMRPAPGTPGRNNPCFGKAFPITVSSQSSLEAVIKINGASVVPGCIDKTVTFKSVDGKSMEGTLPDGKLIKLEKK